MKLYLITRDKKKVYLAINAQTREELAEKLGGQEFTISSGSYSVKDVKAEQDTSYSSKIGTTIGAAVGMLGGPIGAVVGGVAGLLLSGQKEDDEDDKVKAFNESSVPARLLSQKQPATEAQYEYLL